MIVRILNEGQWEVADADVQALNALDDVVEKAVSADDQAQLSEALAALLDRVRTVGTPVADDDLRDSDLILPDSDSTIADVRGLLSESDEGLIPN
ncbi:MAG TPA: hypothetical protein VIT20_03600 [Propionibacteriaceae bacterium]